MPGYAEWLRHQATFRSVARILEDVGSAPILARHPVAWLSRRVYLEQRPLESVTRALERAASALAASRSALRAWRASTLMDEASPISQAPWPMPRAFGSLAGSGSAATSTESDSDVKALRAIGRRPRAEAERSQGGSRGDHRDTGKRSSRGGISMRPSRSQEPSKRAPSASSKPAWWRLRKVLLARYDFAAHAVRSRLGSASSWTSCDWSTTPRPRRDRRAAGEAAEHDGAPRMLRQLASDRDRAS